MLLLLLLLLFLTPVAVYCLVLAIVNRRARPTMASGMWDCLGLLLAASGFLLGAGPGLLYEMFAHRARDPIENGAADLQQNFHQLLLEWWFFWIGYYVVVLAGTVTLLLWRRHKTVIYNADPLSFENLFARVVDEQGLLISRKDDAIVVYQPGAPPLAELTLESFPAMCHMTLHWLTYPAGLRSGIETALRGRLAEARTYDNPSSGWFLAVSAVLFSFIFLIATLMFLIHFMPIRRW